MHRSTASAALDFEHGSEHVAAYLRAVDLEDFNPNAPPPRTEWFWSIVDAGRAPEESELATLLDSMGTMGIWPDAVTLAQLVEAERRRAAGSNLSELPSQLIIETAKNDQ